MPGSDDPLRMAGRLEQNTLNLKLDANGNVVVENGMPVYIHDDGKEIPFDAVAAMTKITSLNGEAKTHREAK